MDETHQPITIQLGQKKQKKNPKMTKSKPKRKHIHKSYENTIDLNNFGMRKKKNKT